MRGPASQCGLFGIRPSFGRISLEGCAGLCPPYDTAGILASEFTVFEKSTRVLIESDPIETNDVPQIVIPDDIYELFGEKVVSEIDSVVELAEELWGKAEHVKAAPFNLSLILKAYQKLQGREVWKHYGNFIEKYHPSFGPGVKERFEFSHKMSLLDLSEEETIAQQTVSYLNELLAGGKIILLPTLTGRG